MKEWVNYSTVFNFTYQPTTGDLIKIFGLVQMINKTDLPVFMAILLRFEQSDIKVAKTFLLRKPYQQVLISLFQKASSKTFIHLAFHASGDHGSVVE